MSQTKTEHDRSSRRQFLGWILLGVSGLAGFLLRNAARAVGQEAATKLGGGVSPGAAAEHVVDCAGGADLQASRIGIRGRRWVMVMDLAKCDGCDRCIVACSKMHFVPPDRYWIKVLRMQDAENTAPYYFPQPCYQCDNPPCTKVCPVDATFKRQDGVVLIDNTRCIGCRFCMAACPYSARSFNWGRPQDPPPAKAHPYSPECGIPRRIGTVEKCDFCPNLAAQGILPACSAGCPMGVIYYGDENEDAVTNSKGDTQRLSVLLKDRSGYLHLEELGTKPRVYYLPPTNRMYPAPGEKKAGE